MSEAGQPGLEDVSVYRLNRDGTGAPATLADTCGGPSDVDCAFHWVHLPAASAEARAWLEACGLDRHVIEALTAMETRPRCTVHGNAVLLNLRGVNLNPGAEPEDMISVRLWIEERRVIGAWLRPLTAIDDLREAIDRGQGPVSPSDFVAKLALRLADRAEPVVAALNERIDDLEEATVAREPAGVRAALADIRRTAIRLRRYMLPQRDALTTLEIEDLPWLTERDRSRLREAAERVTRLGEELDAIRDRAQVVHDLLMDARAETLNRQMLLLAIVAAIFLPLTLVSGLLGMNVGGIPGAGEPRAFWMVCLLLLLVSIGLVWLFRRLRLL